jgi:hypothetical protein
VLARRQNERNEDVRALFANVPYLNSSLFEPTEMEHQTLFISNLKDDKPIPIFSQTVLKDSKGKKLAGQLTTLDYFFKFLDAYDFSSEGREEIQEDNKTLINASVLGLIFEKINGYKDGSFFTPGFITMYMARETIRKAVVQKFNEAKGWHCRDIRTLYDKIEDRNEANKIINDLKICDPAVGSGHFLVSALNEIIAIKSELGVLLDRNGRSLKEYLIEVVNDELSITEKETDDFFYYVAPTPRAEKNIQNKFDGDTFQFLPHQIPERQRVQQTLFHEKQIIIENCLFGVDINPNSVKICRLRLWIELLKNAYYKPESNYTELETLPNIDINIKCGNSLISRFDLNADLKQIAKSTRWNIGSYQNAVDSYKNSSDKQVKHEIERLIQEIKHSYTEAIQQKNPLLLKYYKLKQEYDYKFPENGLFAHELDVDYGGNLKHREEEKQKFANELLKIKTQLEDEKLFSQHNNAFEWRFEFPEVLNENGDFVGFDVVIGNPPYIRQEAFTDIKLHLQQNYITFTGIADLYVYFVERGIEILRNDGNFIYILPNKWMRAGYGKNLRNWVKQFSINYIVDFGDLPVFDEAITYPCLWAIKKTIPTTTRFDVSIIDSLSFPNGLANYVDEKKFIVNQEQLNGNSWILVNDSVQNLLNKIKTVGKSLNDYVEAKVYRGVLTGLNEAFVIDETTKNILIDEDPKNKEIIKPFIEGKDVKRYQQSCNHKWLIFTKRGIDINQYPSILKYLKQFKEKLLPKPSDYIENDWKGRKEGNYKWYEIQDAVDYYGEFEKPKIIYPNICKQPEFIYDTSKVYTNQKCFIIPCSDLFLLGLLNSNLIFYLFKNILPRLRGDFYEPSYAYFKYFPIANAEIADKEKISSIVSQIITNKKQNPSADTTVLETQIDQMVYQLYGLTEEEIVIVENSVK